MPLARCTARHFDGKHFFDAGRWPRFDYRDPFTIAAWIKPEAATGAIVSRGDDYFGRPAARALPDGRQAAACT